MLLKVTVENNKPAKIILQGSINEEADLKHLFSKMEGDTVLDMGDVDKVNSIGIMKWLPLIRSYTVKNKVDIERLSYTLAIQANIISDLFSNATIRSTLAPYFCPKCKTENLVEITREDLKKSQNSIPAANCKACSSAMTFDELPTYFDFMRRPLGS